MKSILEDFLSLGKLEEGLIQNKQEVIPADDLLVEIQKIMEEMKHQCKEGQRIILHREDHFPAYIDKQLLRNILLNLLSNAIKFSNDDGTITINCITGKDKLTIHIEDEGIGISEEDQEHLFDRFFRAKNAINIQGTGLGLHIVNKYLGLMNGSIEIRSQLNKGTTISFYIPFKAKH